MMPSSREDADMMDTRNNNLINDQMDQVPKQPAQGLSKAELRKSNKPIMEKKRRARINHCLNELKTLILEAMKKDPARHTKLEKADILEMTVKHLQNIQRSQIPTTVGQSDPTIVHKFKAGFADCTDEVSRYIKQIDGIDMGVKQRLIGHLNSCVAGLQQVSPYSYGTTPVPYRSNTIPSFGTTSSPIPLHQHSGIIPLQQDLNNNGRINMGGVQLIPSRLPTGELALVMPNSSNLSYFPSTFHPPPPPQQQQLQQQNLLDLNNKLPRPSAFNTVTKPVIRLSVTTTNSPPLSPISSISSGEDSLPATGDYQNITTTPPLQSHSHIMDAFPTPPSGGSIKINHNRLLVPDHITAQTLSDSMMMVTTATVTVPLTTTTVQQPHVTSTSEFGKAKPLAIITNTNQNWPKVESQYPTKKRPYPSDGLLKMVDGEREPSEKKIKIESEHHRNPSPHDLNGQVNGDMWRPW